MVVAQAVQRLRAHGYQVKASCEHFGLNLSTYKHACRRLKYPMSQRATATSAIIAVSKANSGIYGYRRILAVCRQNGWTIGEKTVRAIMYAENLTPKSKRTMRHRSYKGENAHRPANKLLIGDLEEAAAADVVVSQGYSREACRRREALEPDLVHDFYADRPNEKFGTDVTEFACRDGKVYFSPLIDFHDNLPLVYTMSTSPTAALTNTMLEAALTTIKPGTKPVIHSDRGWAYRHPEWVSMLTDPTHDQAACGNCDPGKPCDNAWVAIPSLSRLGKSGDNDRVEGFFGLLKRELYAAGINSQKMGTEEFMNYLETHLDWFVYQRLTRHPGKGYTTLAEQRALATAI